VIASDTFAVASTIEQHQLSGSAISSIRAQQLSDFTDVTSTREQQLSAKYLQKWQNRCLQAKVGIFCTTGKSV
jgi:hypothetical protein